MISRGMAQGIANAERLGLPVERRRVEFAPNGFDFWRRKRTITAARAWGATDEQLAEVVRSFAAELARWMP